MLPTTLSQVGAVIQGLKIFAMVSVLIRQVRDHEQANVYCCDSVPALVRLGLYFLNLAGAERTHIHDKRLTVARQWCINNL